MHWYYGGWGWGWAMGIVMLAFWALVVVAIVYFVRWVAEGSRPVAARPGSALEVLNARYARGEITREQYLQMRQDLEARPPGPATA